MILESPRKVAIREKINKCVVQSLAGERRPLPISEKEAFQRIDSGLKRMTALGLHFEPLEVSELDQARRHAEANLSLPADYDFSYAVEIGDQFVFSGYNGMPPGPGAEAKYQSVFLYGFAVNKSDGQIYRWKEPLDELGRATERGN